MASPTVLMLPSSSSGMATPNLSSTAVAISTIDSESTSRSSVKDFSGVASAGVTAATPAGHRRRPGRASRQSWGSGQAQDLPSERQSGAVDEDQREVARLGLA